MEQQPVIQADICTQADSERALRRLDHAIVLGSPVVTMMQPTESFLRNDTAGVRGTSPPRWRSLPESEVCAVLVVVANVVGEKSLQMGFVHRNDVIQQVSPTPFDPPLRHRVLPSTLERGSPPQS